MQNFVSRRAGATMGCSASTSSRGSGSSVADRVEPLGDIRGTHLDLWLMAAFSAAATAWVFRDDDRLEKAGAAAVCKPHLLC